MNKQELIKYLNEYLKVSEYVDDSKNGLQVDSEKTEIKKLGFCVDATTYLFDKAIEEGVDMVLSHHGMFWGSEEVLVGVSYARAKKLLDNDICLYASHLPLDAHPEVGNNIGLLKAFINVFGLREGEYEIEKLGEYKGQTIGFGLRIKSKVHISNLVTTYAEQMQLTKKLYNYGKKDYISSIAFVSGGGGGVLQEINYKGYDLFVTGELNYGKFTLAKEMRQGVFIGGHYETEKIGPKLLAYHLRDKFGIDIVFLDEKY